MAALANRFGLSFHHFGWAVRTPAPAFIYLASLGYSLGSTIFDSLQRVNLSMCCHPEMPDVELIWPSDGPSPVDNLIKRRGSAIYHLCYTSADAEGAVAAMEAAGLRVLPVSPPQPAVLFGGRPVSFYNIADLGLIEIIHGKPDDATLRAGQ
jgi:hypothetical protein